MKHRTLLMLSLGLTTLAACGGNEEAADPGSTSTAAATSLPDGIWSATPLADAKDVKDVRESAKDGDHVVLRGTVKDFGELATLQLVEDSIEDCSEMEEDHCETPWDYCCEAPDNLARNTVNVEFLDGDLPGSWSLRGAHGLDHLSEVTVAGTLRVDEAGNLRLEAERLAMQ